MGMQKKKKNQRNKRNLLPVVDCIKYKFSRLVGLERRVNFDSSIVRRNINNPIKKNSDTINQVYKEILNR